MFSRPWKENEFAIYECLNSTSEFLKSTDLVQRCNLSPGKVLPVLDTLYENRLIMTRFVVGNQAIIVTVEEVRIPEFGFSRELDKLLLGIGLDKDNWTSMGKDYSAIKNDGSFPDFIPETIIPFTAHELNY